MNRITTSKHLHDRILGGILGLVVGDALGVPVEFQDRRKLQANPVTDMIGYGTHNQPPGTWSDDSSLALATTESLLDGYDPNDMMSRFSRWRSENYMTPHGQVFDIGISTDEAITRFDNNAPQPWGGCDEQSNGNGSLMRILPLSIYSHTSDTETIIARSMQASALTHAHIRSQLCCAYYSLLVCELLSGADLKSAMQAASNHLQPHVPESESPILSRILSGSIINQSESQISSTGYVVHCLEASLWCLWNSNTFAEAVLSAVNLGDDTDTTAAVTGGIAGVMFGRLSIPTNWINSLIKLDLVSTIVNTFADGVAGK